MKIHPLTLVIFFHFGFLSPSGAGAQPVRWEAAPPIGQTSENPLATVACSETTPSLAPLDSLGPIRLDMTLELLEAQCDALEYDWIYLEGEPVPVALTLLGIMPVVVQFADTLPGTPIYRVTTNSEAARTSDGVGPGMELTAVARLWPDLRIAFGEGASAVSEAHPGIAMEIAMPAGWDWEAAQTVRRSGDWSALPNGSFVASVALVGVYSGHRKD